MSTKLKLISNDGSYLRTKFELDNSVWTLIGTESIQSQVNTFRLTQEQKTEQLMITTHDTFKSNKGKYDTKMRLTFKKMADDSLIKAID